MFVTTATSRKKLPALQKLSSSLYREVVEILPKTTASDPIVVIEMRGDDTIIGREGRIVQELERLLLYAMDSGSVVGEVIAINKGELESTVRRARLDGATWLLRCVVGVDQSKIYITADLIKLPTSFWGRMAKPVPVGADQHIFVSSKLDEEVGLLLGKSRTPLTVRQWKLAEVIYVPHRLLDVGLGNLDGSGSSELVLLSEKSIDIYSIDTKSPRRLSTYDLTKLPDMKMRVRDPAGSLLVVDFNQDGNFEVFYKLFNRLYGEILVYSGNNLVPLRKLKQVPLCVYHSKGRAHVLYGRQSPGTNYYENMIELTDINQSTGKQKSLPGQFYSMRCWQKSKDAYPWIAFVDRLESLFRVELTDDVLAIESGVGAAFGIVDLDGEGGPEMVLSDPVLPREQDGVRIVTEGSLVWKSKDIVGSIVAISAGNIDDEGQEVAVIASVEPSGNGSRVYILGK
jgi:hypothetical protein